VSFRSSEAAPVAVGAADESFGFTASLGSQDHTAFFQ